MEKVNTTLDFQGIVPPVLILLFNRLDNAVQLIECLRSVKPAKLYVSIDGPRQNRSGEESIVAAVREVVGRVDWPCAVLTNFYSQNQGIKYGPSGGITWFFEHEEMGIILEDDCLPDPTFFEYCRLLLDKYRNDSRIMMISGCDFVNSKLKPDNTSYYMHKYQLIWGWATWRRAWHCMDLEMEAWSKTAKWSFISEHCSRLDEKLFWIEIFNKMAQKNDRTTWDYQWIFSMWLSNGLCISPHGNLVRNIGFGETGTHLVSMCESHDVSIQPMSFPLRHPPVEIAQWMQEQIRIKFYMTRRRGWIFIASWVWRKLKGIMV